MARSIPPFTILVKEGGRYIAGGESGAVSARDYVEKTNFRRLDDAEVRREGTILFKGNPDLDQEDQAFGADEVVGLWEAVRPNGDRALVLLTPTDVYRFVYASGEWEHVGGPYTSCLVWQVASIDGYLIFNNAVDLPFTFRVEESATVPIYEMRDVGIASVGTICVYNGFLLVADVSEIQPEVLPVWMTDGGLKVYLDDLIDLYNYTPVSTRTGEYHSDPSGKFGWLPGPGTITTYHPYDADQDGDISPTEMLDATEDYNTSAMVLPGEGAPDDPYGVVPGGLLNRIRYKIAWCDSGEPRNWAPLILNATIESADKDEVVLPYPMPYSFPVGSKLAVIGAGPSGGTLGGQVGIDDGVVVTAVDGDTLTLSVAADAALTYPLTVQVVRFADVSTFAGSSSIKDDSSAVLLMKPLKRGLIVYRETGLWIGRYTAVVETPFVFTPEWYGRLVPSHPRAVADINGDYHLYPVKDRFYYFDGAGQPRIHKTMDDARSKFFDGLTVETKSTAFAVANPITKEVWFMCPNGVLAYDYAGDTASWIDETYSAAAYVRKPESDEFWFIVARVGRVMQYGATEEETITYLRAGEPLGIVEDDSEEDYTALVPSVPVPLLEFGVTSLGDDFSEKVVESYMPLLGTGSSDIDITVLLYGSDNYSEDFEELLSFVLETPATLPLIETFYSNIYFQDTIQVTDTADVNVVFVGRSFVLGRIHSKGATRNYNGAA
jgi:hypothetical protein